MTTDVTPTPTGSAIEPAAPATGGGLLRGCGLAFAMIAGLFLLFLVVAWLQLQSQFRAPEAVAVSETWQQAAVRLSPDRPAVQGQLAIAAPAVLDQGVRIAMTVGLPVADPSAQSPGTDMAPADLLRGSAVRLTATLRPGVTMSCLAPCELDLRGSLAPCGADACRQTVDIRVEQLDAGGSTLRPAILVTVAGGAAADLRHRLPDGVAVELALDEASP